MKRIVMSLIMGTMLLGTAGVALAQNEINERQRNQQKRIGEGVENGSLTAGETARLEKQEGAIHRGQDGAQGKRRNLDCAGATPGQPPAESREQADL